MMNNFNILDVSDLDINNCAHQNLLAKIQSFINMYTTGVVGTVSVVAFDHDQIIAIGSLSDNKYHPFNAYPWIIVASQYRRQNVGSSLLNRLKDQVKTQKLQCGVESINYEQIAFLKHNGFVLARKSYLLKIDLNILQSIQQHKRWACLIQQSISNLTLSQMAALKVLVHANYIQYHQCINPLNQYIDAEAFFHSLKDIDPQRSIVLFDQMGNICLYMLLGIPTDKSIEIAYWGASKTHEIEQTLFHFKQACFQLLQTFSEIHVEMDDTDFYAVHFLQLINLESQVSFDTYLYPN